MQATIWCREVNSYRDVYLDPSSDVFQERMRPVSDIDFHVFGHWNLSSDFFIFDVKHPNNYNSSFIRKSVLFGRALYFFDLFDCELAFSKWFWAILNRTINRHRLVTSTKLLKWHFKSCKLGSQRLNNLWLFDLDLWTGPITCQYSSQLELGTWHWGATASTALDRIELGWDLDRNHGPNLDLSSILFPFILGLFGLYFCTNNKSTWVFTFELDSV